MGHSDSKLAGMHIPAEMTTRAFPRRFAATHKKSLTRIMALLSDPDRPDDGPAYAVSWTAGWYGSMTFHSGPTKDHEPLATAQSAGKLGSDFNVTLPALGPDEQRTEIMRHVPSLKREKWWFAIRIGGAGAETRVERFEWRRSRGAEVKGIGGGSGWGWKLVRMGNDAAGAQQPAEEDGADDDADDDDGGRADGFTSDGKEVVAVWADAGLSLSRMGALEFRGSGATGELGLLWSIMAAVTCMCIWQLRQQRNTSAAVSAGAS